MTKEENDVAVITIHVFGFFIHKFLVKYEMIQC